MIAETLRLAGDGIQLRPFVTEDAPRVAELADNWNIASMLSRMPHPYAKEDAVNWISGQRDRRTDGGDWPFAIETQDGLVGAAGVSPDDEGRMEIGYWIGEPYWGRGIASEAARTVSAFAFDILGLQKLTAGYFRENPASGRVLTKVGFHTIGEAKRFCLARGEAVDCVIVELSAEEFGR